MDQAGPLERAAHTALWGMLLLLGLSLVARVEVLANDDTYVYFTYARSFFEGRPFAYDPRGLPSQGFTSLVYLLLLVPFEGLGVDMNLAACALNLLATGLLVGLVARLAHEEGLPGLAVGVAGLALLVSDGRTAYVIGRGLETMLGPASLALGLWCLVRVARGPDRRARWALAAALPLCFLVRPESPVVLLAVSPLLLEAWRRGEGAALARAGLAAVAAVAAWLLLALGIFGDPLPTGYYRKLGSGRGGLEYVQSAVVEALPWLALVAALGLALAAVARGRLGEGPLRGAAALGLVVVATAVAFLPSHPIVGYAHRYLVAGWGLLYFLIAWLGAWLLAAVLPAQRARLASAGLALCVGLGSALSGPSLGGDRLDLPGRAARATAAHHYVALGTHLRSRLSAPEQVTLVMGDAGAVPYTLGSRFIDPNGLTEPAIARLFALPDGEEKTARFLAHLLAHEPDLVVLGFGPAAPSGLWLSPTNTHSPFRGPMPAAVFAGLRDAGLEYACSVRAYYDLHLGVRRGSPHRAELLGAVGEACSARGYRLPAFAVRAPDGDVAFPAVR